MSGTSKRLLAITTAAAAALMAVACADLLGTNGTDPLVLGPAFQTIPVGFSANTNSFDPSGDAGVAFFPGSLTFAGGASFDGTSSGNGGDKGRGNNGRSGGEGEHRSGEGGDHHDGFGDGGIRGILMGGGLGPDFIGKIAFGRGRGRGPFGVFNLPESCTFSDATGRVTCAEFAKHGLTVNVSFAFKDAGGNAQPKFDTATTNSVNVKTSVSGTKARDDDGDDDDDITSTVSHNSDLTVGGLAPGSTQRTVDGTAEAHEETSGTRDGVAFKAVRDATDAITGLVIPIVENHPTIPSAGSIVRTMTVTITKDGSDPVTKSRREEITFDGTNVISVKITQDGVTKNCTLTLPGRDLSCE